MSHTSIASDIVQLGGVAHIQDLLSLGYSRRKVAALAHAGLLIRPRIGWYASPALAPDEVRALRVGGRLGCISAARAYGLPTPPENRLHVTVDAHATRLRWSTDAGRHVYAGGEPGVVWHRATSERSGDRVRVPVLTCLTELIDCVPFEWAVAAVDRARNEGLVDDSALGAALERSPAGRAVLASSDRQAESFLESMMRVRLSLVGISARSQVPVGPYRADFIIEEWLAVECDGGTHAVAEQFERDRRRDAYFAAAGLRNLRFSYAQVMREWPSTLHTIQVVLRQGPPERPLD